MNILLITASVIPLLYAATDSPAEGDYQRFRYGLFIHWSAPGDPQGIPNIIKYRDGSAAKTIDEFANSIDVVRVANEIASLAFEIVYLTDFHGFGTTLHPSPVLDKWRGPGYASKRDLVGEMIDALNSRGVATVLFTHPLDGHDFSPQDQKDKLGWNDPAGGYKTWNDFINEAYVELTEQYGARIAGMGFDSEWGQSGNAEWIGKLDLPRLRNTISNQRPDLPLISLTGPNEVGPFGMREVYDPSWFMPWKSRKEDDYNVEDWPAYTNTAAIVQGHHWTTITSAAEGCARLNAVQLYRYTVLQTSAATEGAGILWAASPFGDGSWEKGVGEVFHEVMDRFGKQLEQSVKHTWPSTSWPVKEGAKLSTLPHGAVTVRSQDDRFEYVHVMNPQEGAALNLPPPADGKRFTSASLLSNDAPVTIVQDADGVHLSLATDTAWDPVDTVIKLVVAPDSIPRRSLAWHKTVTASTSEETQQPGFRRGDWGVIRLVDGVTISFPPDPVEWSITNRGWSSTSGVAAERVEWVKIDLGDVMEIAEVVLHPANSGEGFPVDYAIKTSVDGVNWSVAASITASPLPASPQHHEFAPVQTRYVLVEGARLQPNPAEKGASRMRLAEVEVFCPKENTRTWK